MWGIVAVPYAMVKNLQVELVPEESELPGYFAIVAFFVGCCLVIVWYTITFKQACLPEKYRLKL